MKIVPFCDTYGKGWAWRVEFYINEDTAWLRKTVGWIVNIVVALACAWFLVYGLCVQVQVSGNSMQPLLDTGDVVLVNRLIYDVAKPQRFDVVVFERGDNKKNVKRVIGLPGETVQIRGGFIYIDGERLDTGNELEEVSLAGRAENPVRLDADEYFLLGDNRDSSEDSRFSNIGNVREDQILGKVWFRILPLLKLELLPSL
jgi:signal peptidase I